MQYMQYNQEPSRVSCLSFHSRVLRPAARSAPVTFLAIAAVLAFQGVASAQPDAPTNLTAAAVSDTQIDLEWRAPTNTGGTSIIGYLIEVSSDGGSSYTDLQANTGSTDVKYSHSTGLTAGTTRHYRVSAINTDTPNTSLPSNIANATTWTVPDAPTVLTAEAVSATQIDLEWRAPTNTGGDAISSYLIEWSPNGNNSTYNTLATSTSTSYSDSTNLSAGTTRYYQVSATTGVGTGDPSDPANATTWTVPDAPTVLTAEAVSATQIDLEWRAPTNTGGDAISSYLIEWSPNGNNSTYNTLATSTSTSYSDSTNLSAGTTRYYQVSATTGVGTGDPSDPANARTWRVPYPPTRLTASPDGQDGPTQINLVWVAPLDDGGKDISGYRIEVSSDGGSSYTDLQANTGSTDVTYSHTNLSAGDTRYYRVSAINEIGTGSPSNFDDARTWRSPDPPTNLRAKRGDGQVTLRWQAPTDTGGEPITHYEYEQNGDGIWHTTGGTGTSFTVSGLTNGEKYTFRVRAVTRAVNLVGEGASSAVVSAKPRDPPTVPDAPRNLLADIKDGVVTLSWDAPFRNGGATITDYEYQIDGEGEWISIGSTNRIHTITGLTNGTVHVFRVRAVNRIGSGRASNRAVATPGEVLDFAHFANGAGIISDLVFVNVSPHPTRPALYFSDQGGDLIDSASVVDLTGDLVVAEDGSLTVHTEMESLGQLTISTHGRGELVSGSVRVVSSVPIGGLVRYSIPGVGVAVVGASPPVRDVLFPARRQEGGIRTAAALHNLQEEAVGVNCRLMSGGVALEEVEIPLEANGQASWFIEEAFPTTDTSDFLGSVRCTVPGNRRFTAIAVEMDAAKSIFTTLPVVPVDRMGGSDGETVLNFAHFANGTWITDLVFMNLSIQPSGPPPSPFHTAILPSRPAIYFYDTKGNPIAPTSVVDLTGDLEVTEDGALTVRTEMEPLEVLTISTHGRGELVTGSVRVVSDGPIGGMLRFDHPAFGLAAVGASPPVSGVISPVRRREGGINTGVALHNLESSWELVRCELMREGVLRDAVSIVLEANGQTSWLIDAAFPGTDTSDFAGSVRCTGVGGGLFTAVVLEMDSGTRTFITVPVVPVAPVPERMSQE